MPASPDPDEPDHGAQVVPLDPPDGGPVPRSATGTTSHSPAAVAGPVLDAELVDDDPTAEPVQVDPPTESADRSALAVRLAEGRSVTRRAIVAPWLRSRAEFAAVLRWALAHLGHTTAFHVVRLPVYAGRLAWRAPAGALRVLVTAGRWVTDAEGAPLRLATVTSATSTPT
jgi:S-DNA-T family DNA segregation ATPase FtsK/SpoIIIE